MESTKLFKYDVASPCPIEDERLWPFTTGWAVNGYIVKHAVFGIGKVIEWPDLLRQPFKVRFYETGSNRTKEVLFDRSALGRQVDRTVLPPGSRCCARRGRCVIVDILKFASDGQPAEYEVEFENDNGLRATVAESDLEPSVICEVRDPALMLGGLQAGGYPIFRAREQLADAIFKLLRDGNGLRALLSSRVDLRPHQAYVAGVVLLDRRRRYLLADEVGLGKTIEAGIVLADLLAQQPDASVLVVCPGALTQQWLCELYSKFSQGSFVMPDLRGGQTDWPGVSRVIVSMTQALGSAAAIASRHWDLVIVDEAHHLLGSPPLYQLAMELSRQTTGLLMLSALPAQEREEEFLRLLALLEPDRYEKMTAEKFAELYHAQQEVGRKMRLVSRRLEDLAAGERTVVEVMEKAQGLLGLSALQADPTLRRELDSLASTSDAIDFAGRCQRLLHYVGDAYRINRRILRNRRHRLAEDGQIESIPRRLEELDYIPDQLEIDATQAVQSLLFAARSKSMPNYVLVPLARVLYQSLAHPPAALSVLHRLAAVLPTAEPSVPLLVSSSHLIGYDEWGEYLNSLLQMARPYCDNELIDAAVVAVGAWASDASTSTRAKRLFEFLKPKASVRGAPPKILLFAGFPGIAADVANWLQAEFGVDSVASFHHDLSRKDKETNVTRFRINARTWILVCDETGGEGRNFQFASEIVHFDTPWYASRIEQRIGRLDRLGREAELNPEVVSNVLYNRWSPEAGLIACYRDGLDVFARSLSGLEFALRDVERSLAEAAVNDGTAALERLVPQIQAKAREERARDDSDAVFDAASFERVAAEKYWRVSDSSQTEAELEAAFVEYFRMIAGNGAAYACPDDETARGVWLLSPADVRQVQLLLANDPQTGVPRRRKGTFRRASANARPDLSFFTIGDELFDAVTTSMATEGIGRTYAVECAVPGVQAWVGFEVVVACAPQVSGLEKHYIGLANRARQVIHPRPIHVFVAADGTIADDAASEAILQLRRSLTRDNKGRTWWNLTKEKAQLLHRAFPAGKFHQTVRESQQRACEVARQSFGQRLARDLDDEDRRINEMIRLARLEGPSSDAEVQAMEGYRKAIRDWLVCVDAIGFLSVNGGLKT
ncbi:MAG: SNF2-related protein [Bacillota bacterium]